jgi:hypothetical protein
VSSVNFTSWGFGVPNPPFNVAAPAFPVDNFSIRFYGSVIPSQTTTYRFVTSGDDGAILHLFDGTTWIKLIDRPFQPGLFESLQQLTLTSGMAYPIILDYTEFTGSAGIQLAWKIGSATAATTIPPENLSTAFDVANAPVPATITPTPSPSPVFTATPIPTTTPGNCTINVIAQPAGNTNPGINLREAPSLSGRILLQIPWSTQLIATHRLVYSSTNSTWYQVTYNGTVGWIAAQLQGTSLVTNPNCSLPSPYPDNPSNSSDPQNWRNIAQISNAELGPACDLDTYLRNEAPSIVLARIAFAEASVFTIGSVVYEDAFRIAWVVRMDALMGLPRYGSQQIAGSSIGIADMVLSQGAFEPITNLKQGLSNTGCNPQSITDTAAQKFAFPTDSDNSANLFQLWTIYQRMASSVINSNWNTMNGILLDNNGAPRYLRGYEQFKGIDATTQTCSAVAGANGLTRPGSGFTSAQNQPYPPQPVTGYTFDLNAGSGSGNAQPRKTCYQDVYHLDDWFLSQANSNISTNMMPQTFPVIRYCPVPGDEYFLAQLPIPGGVWPIPQPC